MGFNTFLPPGYRIESTNNPDQPLCVITPHEAHVYDPNMNNQALPITTGYEYEGQPMIMPESSMEMTSEVQAPMISEEPAPQPVLLKQREYPENRAPVEFNHAINYVNKIKVYFLFYIKYKEPIFFSTRNL
jgi:paired amphipathic helix protein Sin3a